MKRFLLIAALMFVSPMALQACEPVQCRSHYEWVTTWQTVHVWETRCVPYTKTVILTDHCGREYEVTKTCYRDVRVSVCKQVPVRKRILVCD